MGRKENMKAGLTPVSKVTAFKVPIVGLFAVVEATFVKCQIHGVLMLA